MIRFDLLTLHPKLVEGPLETSILGRARAAGLIEIGIHDIRDYSENKHRTVDDAPYGGGAGMVMRVDVVARAIEAVRSDSGAVYLTSPKGPTFNQARAESLSTESHIVIVCGHYEGIDSRIEGLVDGLISLGDFVLTGGEIAALAVVDSVARLVPGVLGNASSAQDESFSDGLLEYPQFTRPREWRGEEVPAVLLSGHHERIQKWRVLEAEAATRSNRPDLWEKYQYRNSETAEKPEECESVVDESAAKE